MLGKLGDKIDAVIVATPDHTHAGITLAAIREGKHVFTQKPLTHNVWEARQIQKAAAGSKVITRMGNQIHSHKFYRTAVQLVQSGAIGKVKQVHSWVGTTGHGRSGLLERPAIPQTAPANVNWELWIAGAPMRPFGGQNVYHPRTWRDWQDFGNGALGDFGCHIFDPVFTALKITAAPTSIKTNHSGMNDEVWPAQTTVDYTFPGTRYTVNQSLNISWYDGGLLPSVRGSHVPATTALPRSGSLIIGEIGTLVLPHVGAPRLYPEDKFGPFEAAENLNHFHGWIDGCITGKQPSDGFDYAATLTEAVLLGNVGARFKGQTLKWDSRNLRITNVREANRWLKRDYRDGWEIRPA